MKRSLGCIAVFLCMALLTGCNGIGVAEDTARLSNPSTPATSAAEVTTAVEATLPPTPTDSPHPSAADLSALAQPVTALSDYVTGEDTWRPVDLRQKDLSALDLSGDLDKLLHAEFDAGTIWPADLPDGFRPDVITEIARNPGLGISSLHEKGITGGGVGIAVIDTPLYVDHEEYKDRIASYEELSPGTNNQADLHSAFMTSVAVGKDCGVAPGAKVYFYSASVWNADRTQLTWLAYATAVDRVLARNETLADAEKIRVISISAAWQPGDVGYEELEAAIKRATDAGVFVITCNTFIDSGYSFCFQGLDRDPMKDKDDPSSYQAVEWPQWMSMQREGFANYYADAFAAHPPQEILLVPMDSLLSAEPTGASDYIFNRIGGWSAAEPFLAGLYALACQKDPSVTPSSFWAAALATGDVTDVTIDGTTYTGKTVNPVALIDSLG